MATDAFVVTDVGLAAAVNAAEQGIKVVLKTFQIGSAYGYTPQKTDTALHGSILYQDQITNYRVSSDGSLVVTCAMSVDAGPFQFGEIGIFTDGGQLFCLAALAQPLMKYSSLGSNIASTYSFDAYLRLGQSTTVIEIDSITSVTYGQVVGALGFVPYNSTNPAGYVNAASAVAAMQNTNPQFFSVGVGTAAPGVQGQIIATGNIYTNGNVLGLQTSDQRFKAHMQRLDNPMAVLRALCGYAFEWTDDYIASQGGESIWLTKKDVGFLAQEWQTVLPDAVLVREDGSLALKKERLLPYILEGIRFLDANQQAQDKRIEDLLSRLAEVERTVTPITRIGGQ